MESPAHGSVPEMMKICERYRRLYAGLVYDVLEHFGRPDQALSHEIMALAPDMKLAGPAFTVKGSPACDRDETARHRRLEMVKHMRAPCVEVRDRDTPFGVAIYGELSAATAAAHGAVGALVDGGTRDAAKLLSIGFPVFARYRTPIEAFGRWAVVDFQVPVLLSGESVEAVPVNPGDFIFGDYDGALVVPKDLTLKVLHECERVMRVEDTVRVEFARGDDPVEVFRRYKRL